jgi:hypothetical protein
VSEHPELPSSTGLAASFEDAAGRDGKVARETGHGSQPELAQGDATELTDPSRDPDPLDALRAELAMIDHQPVVDRVARFEHANVVLAEALAELDEV